MSRIERGTRPEVFVIIKEKEKHRRSLAALPFDEKIEMIFRLQAATKVCIIGSGSKQLTET